MPDKKSPPDVAAKAERHGRDMQQLNDKLRSLISTLQANKDRFDEARGGAEAGPALTPPPQPAGGAGPVPLDRRRLEVELAAAKEQLARASAERVLLRDRLAELEAEHRRACDEFVESEAQTSQLVQLFATLKQLHGAPGREELLQVLQEVVINVVGSEELAVYEREGGALRLVHSHGLEPAPSPQLGLGEGVLGEVARTAKAWLWLAGQGGPRPDKRLTACIPLTAGDAVVGVLAIYRLLPHKPGLDPSDLAIFELLTPQVGQALLLRRPTRRTA